FGFFVALGFLSAAMLLIRELRRKERAGLLTYTEINVTFGKAASPTELLVNFILGFILGYKFIGLFFAQSTEPIDPQAFIFSTQGNAFIGLSLGLVFAGLKWWEKHRKKMPKPEVRTLRIWPHDRVGDIVILAAVFGFLGAKVFHNLENWTEFWKSPVQALLSFSGLTFYGGLICATGAIWIYARKLKIKFVHLCDAAAPALMIAYAIGRIGCQVSGDGDWGILNSAYVSGNEGRLNRADSAAFQLQLSLNSRFYQEEFPGTPLEAVRHAAVVAPDWMPVWWVAYNYPHNVLNRGVPIYGCTDAEYCQQLPIAVFPTPFYETIMGVLLFLFLWTLRKRIRFAGGLFSVYLIINGLERFFIEKIRVNTTYSLGAFHPTQAELIAGTLFITGLFLYFRFSRKPATR
ncbi:MAG: prolipoprotein diacylglyceryl transferase, partial [Chitinophagaceae bacterium]